MASLPPGVIELEDAIRGQIGLSANAGKPPAEQMYEDYVASPLTKLVSRVAPQNPFQMPSSFDPSAPSTGVAKMIVPQNLTEAGIAAATAGAGGLVGKVGMTGAKAAGMRIFGATLGGAAGKAAEEGEVSTGTLARGAGQGALAGVTGETIGTGINYARKVGMERALAKRDALDAGKVGQALQGNLKLKGVFGDVPPTPEGLRNLALGTTPDPRNPGKVLGVGEARLKGYMDQQESIVLSQLQQYKQRTGTDALFVDPLTPGSHISYDEARKALSKLGELSTHKSATVAGRDMTRGELKQLYAETVRAYQQKLSQVDPKALQAFNDGQGVWEAGTTTLKLLSDAFKKKTAGRVGFNTERLHDILGDREKMLTNKLGVQGFNDLATALRLEGRMGQKDVLSPTGMAANLAGVMPLVGGTYLRGHAGSPNLLGQPFNLPQLTRTGIDIGTSQALGRGLDIAPSPQQILQGIPGLSQ